MSRLMMVVPMLAMILNFTTVNIMTDNIQNIPYIVSIEDEENIREITELTPLNRQEAEIILKYSKQYNIRASLILAMIEIESDFKRTLVGTSNDRGYMQIIPGTEKWIAVEYGKEMNLKYNPDNIFDPNYNIGLGVKYLSILNRLYKNDHKMLTSYNRGDGGMRKYFRKHGTYKTTYSKVILEREKKYLAVNS